MAIARVKGIDCEPGVCSMGVGCEPGVCSKNIDRMHNLHSI